MKPPLDLPARSRWSDDLDGLLRAFFTAEMPQPWPACPQAPVRTIPLPSPARSRWTLARSRVALAASVGLLVTSLWALGGRFTTNVDISPTAPIGGPTGQRAKPYDVDMRLIQEKEGTSVNITVSPRPQK